MSVRNILDGTIRVGGGGTEIGPESQLEDASVSAQALSAQYINASTTLGAASINATEISAGKYSGDQMEIGNLNLKGT